MSVSQVSFSYPTRKDSLVLDRVSLTIEPGSVVALCGPSGSGKSTVVGLLERWYEPTSGSITIDGIPLSALDGCWWRKQVSASTRRLPSHNHPRLFNSRAFCEPALL